MKSELLFRGQSEETLTNDKTTLFEELDQAKGKILQLEAELSHLQGTAELLQTTEEELKKTRDELGNLEQLLEKQTTDLRVSTVENRKEMVNRNSKEEELRRKIRELEKLLEEKDLDQLTDKKKWGNEADRERKELQNIIANLERDNKNLASDLDYQRDELSGEIESLNAECLNLEGVIAEKEELVRAQDNQIAQYEAKIEELTAELKNCL